MVDVVVGYSAADSCGHRLVGVLTVQSSEPASDPGEVDAVVGDDHHVQLRADRAASGPGRIYTITIRATDAAGNTNTATVQVTVPHDSR